MQPAAGVTAHQAYCGSSGIRLSVTGVTSGGALNGAGTGSNMDLAVNFTSLLALFSQPPVIRSTPYAGYPTGPWTYGGCTNFPYVAFSQPLTLSLSTWYNAVPGGMSYESNCNLQGINVGESLR